MCKERQTAIKYNRLKFFSAFYENFDDVQDLIEWNFAILNNAYYLLACFLWRTTVFTVDFKVTHESKDQFT